MNTEIYTYSKDDLLNSIQTIEFPKGNTDKICNISNVAAPLRVCNDNVVGLVSYTNNITNYKEISFTTGLATIITPRGSLVANFSFDNLGSGLLPSNKTVESKPTFTSGMYEKYDNILITVMTLDENNPTRILTISY